MAMAMATTAAEMQQTPQPATRLALARFANTFLALEANLHFVRGFAFWVLKLALLLVQNRAERRKAEREEQAKSKKAAARDPEASFSFDHLNTRMC